MPTPLPSGLKLPRLEPKLLSRSESDDGEVRVALRPLEIDAPADPVSFWKDDRPRDGGDNRDEAVFVGDTCRSNDALRGGGVGTGIDAGFIGLVDGGGGETSPLMSAGDGVLDLDRDLDLSGSCPPLPSAPDPTT